MQLPVSNDICKYLFRNRVFTINLLSSFYPFTPEQREQYRHALNSQLLAKNPSQKQYIPAALKSFAELFQLSEEPYVEPPAENLAQTDDPLLQKINAFSAVDIKRNKQSLYRLMLEVAAEDRPFYTRAICANTEIPWTSQNIQQLIDFYIADWTTLSMNSALPWSETLIDQYLDNWWWGDLATEPKSFIREYRKGVLDNPAISWDIDWLIKYQRYINLDLLSENENIWEKVFKPVVDDSATEYLLQGIKPI